MIAVLVILGFLLVFALPMLPGLFELTQPRDDDRLPIALGYERDPRFFGHSFRRKIAPLLDSNANGRVAYLDRNENAIVDGSLTVPSGVRTAESRIARMHLRCDEGATIRDGFGAESVECAPRVIARTLCSNGRVALGRGSAVERWIDAERSIEIGDACNLGMSASSGGDVTLGSGVRFERVFGERVAVRGERSGLVGSVPGDGTIVDTQNGDVVVNGDAIVAENAVIFGDVKANGNLVVRAGARIAGNAFARETLYLLSGSVVDGHAFGERRLILGEKSRVGVSGRTKTAYTAGTALLCDGASVHGWVISEGGGKTA